MKIVAFAASSSKQSINKKLVSYAANKASAISAQVSSEVLDLNHFEMPLFSVDKEKDLGSPKKANDFLEKIQSADALIISFAEHNGSYTAAYKNLFDWCSRITQKVYHDKPILLLSTSPGQGGAKNVLASASASLPHFGAKLVGELSIAKFAENFDLENNKLGNIQLDNKLEMLLRLLVESK